MVECLTRDRGATGSSLTDFTELCPRAKHINPSLVLVKPRKAHSSITERLLMGRKESNQINKQSFQLTACISDKTNILSKIKAAKTPYYCTSYNSVTLMDIFMKLYRKVYQVACNYGYIRFLHIRVMGF